MQHLVQVSFTPERAVEAMSACMRDLTVQHDSIGARVTTWMQQNKCEIYSTIMLAQVSHDLFFATKELREGRSNVAATVLSRHMHRRLDTRGLEGAEDDARRIGRWEAQWASREGRPLRPNSSNRLTDCMPSPSTDRPSSSRPPTPIRTRKGDKTTKPIPMPSVKRALSPCKFGLRLPSLDIAYSRLISLRSMTQHYDTDEFGVR